MRAADDLSMWWDLGFVLQSLRDACLKQVEDEVAEGMSGFVPGGGVGPRVVFNSAPSSRILTGK